MSERERVDPRLAERVVLVTGGGTGIGLAVAGAFVAAGARVVASGRRADVLEAAVAGLGGAERAIAVPGDVTVAADRDRMIGAAREAFGGLDFLVNSAGLVAGTGPLEQVSEEDWRALFAVDVVAPVLLARAALPLLRERRGAIVNVSTGSSLRPVSGFGAYGAAKAALNHASQVMALETAPEVRVNVVCPGGVDTPIFETFLDGPDTIADVKRRFAEMTPLGRMGRPIDVAEAVVWLCSDAAGWVTGSILTVDGGLNLG